MAILYACPHRWAAVWAAASALPRRAGVCATSRLSLIHIYAVLQEIPRVRKDSGYPPLVTPTSQIVGTQAVFKDVYKRQEAAYSGDEDADGAQAFAPEGDV